MKPAIRVAVTGAAGQISYGLLFHIAAGEMLGPDQPVILQLLEIPAAMDALKGVCMELADCAYPLLSGVLCSSDPFEAFADADYALLIGARPRGPGMERKDLLRENAKIFSSQGRALNANASRSVRVLVVGNPANTNALIASVNAPDIAPQQFSAMTRLDHHRAIAQLADRVKVPTSLIQRLSIWGNHSATQYPDIFHATVDGNRATELVDEVWLTEEFIPAVQQRGAEIIQARGAASAASAAAAAVAHVRSWVLGTPPGDWTSMAVISDGSYGIGQELFYSYPVTCAGGQFSIVEGLEINAFSRQRMIATQTELEEERDGVRDLL